MLARLQFVTDRSFVFTSISVNLKEHTTTLRALVTVQPQSPWRDSTPTVLQILSFGCMAGLNKTRLGFVLGCIYPRCGASIGIDADSVRIFM